MEEFVVVRIGGVEMEITPSDFQRVLLSHPPVEEEDEEEIFGGYIPLSDDEDEDTEETVEEGFNWLKLFLIVLTVCMGVLYYIAPML